MADTDPIAPPPTDPPVPVAEVYPPLPSEEQPPPVEKPPMEPVGQPQPPPQQTTVVKVNPVVTQAPAATLPTKFGATPVTFTDSNGQQVTTQIQYMSGLLTYAIAGAICFFTGCICLVPIPFCIDATKDVVHFNPNDGSVLGVYKRLN